MFAVGDKVRVQAYVPYEATVTRVGRPGTWYPGGATEVMVAPDDGRHEREVSSRDLTLVWRAAR